LVEKLKFDGAKLENSLPPEPNVFKKIVCPSGLEQNSVASIEVKKQELRYMYNDDMHVNDTYVYDMWLRNIQKDKSIGLKVNKCHSFCMEVGIPLA
jgi:hypothetical protein